MMMKTLFIFFVGILFLSAPQKLYSQCCSAGSGSPVAGGTSQGVLSNGQFEVNLSHQYLSTRKFLTGDAPAPDFLNRFYSHFSYLRLGYGLSKEFTLSVESGYYLTKTQIDLDNNSIESKGIADLIIFPRYKVYSHTGFDKNTEVTLGIGYKLPVGTYNDSVRQVEPFSGEVFYYTAPPAVQPTTGSNDFIFYAFLYQGYPSKNIRFFVNSLYVRKGWNPMGEKFGDYASVGFFAGKTIFNKLGVTLQVKGEWIDKMQFNFDVYQAGKYNFDLEATGAKKVLLVPQLNYTYRRNMILYALSEFPLYQYVNKTQVASQYLTTFGLSYRFGSNKTSEVNQ